MLPRVGDGHLCPVDSTQAERLPHDARVPFRLVRVNRTLGHLRTRPKIFELSCPEAIDIPFESYLLPARIRSLCCKGPRGQVIQ